MKKNTLFFLLFFFLGTTIRISAKNDSMRASEYVPVEAPCFTAFKNNPATAVLPDYSYVGYKLGADSIPNVNLTVFNVTKYGALPDDALEDFDGVQAAVNAAVAAGGGIVYFPKGKFLMNEQTKRTAGILIPKGNIILRGSGSGTGGTELFINKHFVPTDTTCMYCPPPLFNFYNWQAKPLITKLALDVKRGDKQITVVNASTLSVGNMIELKMTNPAATNELLAGLTPYPEWTTTINTGITINELHKIAAINGNVITLVEPININMTSSYGWDIYYRQLTQGLGVEDLWFHGNFQESFVHHKNYIHDRGWYGINLSLAENAFLRRLRFTDMSEGADVSGSYACTVMFLRFDGNPGHFMIENNNGDYGTLLGYIDDATNYPGMWHGPGPSASSSATVLWRYRGGAHSGPESHASYPYYTLVDASNCSYTGNGGDGKVLPNHGKDFTYWNTMEIGSRSNIAFWENHLIPPYGNFVKVVKPNVVGWQGNSTFDTSTIGIYESYGKAVAPESLYEAQLALRLVSIPNWIISAKNVWANYLQTSQWPTNPYTIGTTTQVSTPKLNEVVLTPFEGGFNLSVNALNGHYELYSITGVLVKSGELMDYSQFISMSGCTHGVYLIIVRINDEKITKKLIF